MERTSRAAATPQYKKHPPHHPTPTPSCNHPKEDTAQRTVWSGCCPRCAPDSLAAAPHPGWCRAPATPSARPSAVAGGRRPRGRRSPPARRRYRRRYHRRRREPSRRPKRLLGLSPPTRRCRPAGRAARGSARPSTALAAGEPTRRAGEGQAAATPRRPTPTAAPVRATPVAPPPAARALAGVAPLAGSTTATHRRRCPGTTTGGGSTRGGVRPARGVPPPSTTAAAPSAGGRRPWRPRSRVGGKTVSLGYTDACGRRG